MEPAVSILLAVRNEEQFLPAMLKSLQRQTLTDWELVAIDDGSSDRTPQLLSAAAAGDSRLRPFYRPATGLVAALNFGLKNCRAAYVARIDGDDIAHPQRLEKQLTALQQNTSLTLVASRVRHFPRPQIQGGMRVYEDWQNGLLTHAEISRNLFVESPFAHPSVMFRKQAILEIGGYQQRDWAEDYDLWLRLAQSGARFERLPETLLYWRDHSQRLSRTSSHCSPDAFRACKAHYLKQGFLKTEAAVALWGAGPEGKAWRKLLHRHAIDICAWIEVDRKKVGQTIHAARVYAPEQINEINSKILVAVGARGARRLIRDWCRKHDLSEGKHFLCVS